MKYAYLALMLGTVSLTLMPAAGGAEPILGKEESKLEKLRKELTEQELAHVDLIQKHAVLKRLRDETKQGNFKGDLGSLIDEVKKAGGEIYLSDARIERIKNKIKTLEKEIFAEFRRRIKACEKPVEAPPAYAAE